MFYFVLVRLIIYLTILSVKVLNNTHYWQLHTRAYNEVPDTNSFVYQSSRRQSFYLRMYFEYQNTVSNGGKAFFITFTYNNRAIPKYLGYPVFNYEHIRLITNGVISKRLYRDYGCRMKYICACEAGEGGTFEHHDRGLGNNPHYHFIFYVLPVVSGTKLISPDQFFAICQEVWQGKSGYIPWKKARFGSVKPGKFGIEVIDNRAFKYLAKYCTKDNHTLSIESKIHELILSKCLESEYSLSSLNSFRHYLNSSCPKSPYTIGQFARLFNADLFFKMRKRSSLSIKSYFSDYVKLIDSNDPHYQSIEQKYAIKFHKFFHEVILPTLISHHWSEFVNKYSGKVRCSKSLGICGLSQVINPDSDPHFKLIEPSGPKIYKLPLYYIRHLYYDVVISPDTNNPMYVLNRRGHDLKLVTLSKSVSNLYNSTLTNVGTLIDNKLSFFYKFDKYDVIQTAINFRISTDYLKIVYLYSVYNIVYKHRIYSNTYSSLALSPNLKFSEFLEDYDNFLQTDRFKLDFETGTVFNLFKYAPDTRFFSCHHVFAPYNELFEFLDEVNYHVNSVRSSKKKSQFELIAEQNRKLNAYEHSQSV